MNPATAAALERRQRDDKLSLVKLQSLLTKTGKRTVLSLPQDKPKEGGEPDASLANDGEGGEPDASLADDGEGKDDKVLSDEKLATRVAINGDCYVSAPVRVMFTAGKSMDKDPACFHLQRYELHDPDKYLSPEFVEARNVKEAIHQYIADQDSCASNPIAYFTDKFPEDHSKFPKVNEQGQLWASAYPDDAVPTDNAWGSASTGDAAPAQGAVPAWDSAATNEEAAPTTNAWDNNTWGADTNPVIETPTWDSAATNEEAAPTANAWDNNTWGADTNAVTENPFQGTSPVAESIALTPADTFKPELDADGISIYDDNPDFVYDYYPYHEDIGQGGTPFKTQTRETGPNRNLVTKTTWHLPLKPKVETTDADFAFKEYFLGEAYVHLDLPEQVQTNWKSSVHVTREDAAFRYLDRFTALAALDNHDELQHHIRTDIPEHELTKEFFYLRKHVKSYKRTSLKTMEAMATHCKAFLGWSVAADRLKKLFQRVEYRYAFGYYPESTHALAEQHENEVEDQVEEYLLPRPSRDAIATAGTDEDKDAADEAARVMKASKRADLAKRMLSKNPLGEQYIVKPPQNDNVSVRAVFNAQTDCISNVKLKFKLNYIDDKQFGQPFEEVEVILDEFNLRSKPCQPKVLEPGFDLSGYEFREPLWNIEPLSDAEWDRRVALLTNTDIKTVREVRDENPDRRRELLELPYNGAHFSCGIYTARDPAKENIAIQRLQTVLKQPGVIHIFFSKPGINDKIRMTRDAIAYQAQHNVFRRFLQDDRSSVIGTKNLKHPDESPLFKAREAVIYRDGFHARLTNAIGVYYDHVSCNTSNPYFGTASIVPYASTFSEAVGRYMYYEASFKLEDSTDMNDLPKLKPGVSGEIVFSKEATHAEADSWQFHVTDKGIQPGLSRIALQLRRPKSATTTSGWSEREPSTVSLGTIKKMGKNFYQLAQGLPFVDVTLFTDPPNTKDLARIMNSIVSTIPSKVDSEQAMWSKKTGMEVINGRSDHLLPCVKLWKSISPAILPGVREIAYNGDRCAQRKQREVLQDAEENGNPATLMIISGPAGSGKTRVAELAVGPYALEVIHTDDMEADRTRARQQFNDAQARKLLQRLKPGQSDAAKAKAKGRSTDKAPAIELTAEELEYLDGMKPRPSRTLDCGTQVIDGQIATLSQMNATVDHSFTRMEEELEVYRKAVKLNPRLGVRIHSNTTESGMSLSFLNPSQMGMEQDDFYQTELDITGNDVIAQMCSNFKYRNEGPKFKGVRDKRVTITDKSLAHRALELIGEAKLSDGIKFSFTREERENFKLEAEDIVERVVNTHISTKPIDKELGREFRRLMRKLYIAIISRAHHIGCTISMSMDTLIVTYCQFRAIWKDEASRALKHTAFSEFGQHIYAELRAHTGDFNQTAGQMFGKDLDNPFKAASEESPMELFRKRRWLIAELKETRRYYHQDLIKVLQLAYNDESITAAPGIIPDRGMHPKVKMISDFLVRRYNKRGPVMVVNVKNAKHYPSGTSAFSPECAIVAVNIAHEIAIGVPDIRPVIITSYQASKTLLENLNGAKKRELVDRKMLKEANLIGAIEEKTTEEFQGNEGDLVIYVGSKEDYNSFVYNQKRVAVYLSRGKYGLIFVNDTTSISLHKNKAHPLVRFVQWAGPSHTLEVDPFMFHNEFDSFDDVLAFHKLAPLHNKPRAAESRTHRVRFTLDDFEDDKDIVPDISENWADDGNATTGNIEWAGNGGFAGEASAPSQPSNQVETANVGFGTNMDGETWVTAEMKQEQESILADIMKSFKPDVSSEDVESLAQVLDDFHRGEINDVTALIPELLSSLRQAEPSPPITDTDTYRSLENEDQKQMLEALGLSRVAAPVLLGILQHFEWNALRAANLILVVTVDFMTKTMYSGTQVQLAVFENDTATAAVEALARSIGQHPVIDDNIDNFDDDSDDSDDEQLSETSGANEGYYMTGGLPGPTEASGDI
jgi:hypothetical protein